MKGLNHNLLCLMQHCVNGVMIDEVPTFQTTIPSKTTCAIQIENSIDSTHPIIIPLKLNGVIGYFEVRKQSSKGTIIYYLCCIVCL